MPYHSMRTVCHDVGSLISIFSAISIEAYQISVVVCNTFLAKVKTNLSQHFAFHTYTLNFLWLAIVYIYFCICHFSCVNFFSFYSLI